MAEITKNRNKMLKDKKIIIYERVTIRVPGEQLKFKYKPTHPNKLWAYVRQISTREMAAAMQVFTLDTMIFAINWRPDIITLDNIVYYKGIYYSVVRVDTYEGYKDTIKLYVNEISQPPKENEMLPYE